LGIMNYFKRL